MNRNQFNEALQKLDSSPFTKEVLQLLLNGHTNAEIAKLRDKSEGTIRKQVSNLYKKFGIESQFPGDTSSQRDELKALFKQYKPEWVSDLQSAGENEVLVAQTAEQEEALAKLHQESGAGIIALHSNLAGEEISSPIYVLEENESIIYNNSTEIKEQRDEVIAYNYNWLVNYLKSVVAPKSGYLSSESLLDSLDALSQNILFDNQDLVIIYLKEIQKWSTPGNQVVLDDFLKELNILTPTNES